MYHSNLYVNLSDIDYYGGTTGSNLTIPICRYYNVDSESWNTDGCVAVFSNKTLTKCKCDHLTSFTVSSESFIPDINIISETALNNVTFENLRKHPTALIVTSMILLIFWLIIVCLPRINDKPIVAQMRPWCELQYEKWPNTLDFEMDKIMTHPVWAWWRKFLEISWLDLKNNHYILALFLRNYGSSFVFLCVFCLLQI